MGDMMSIDIKNKTLLSISGHGDIEVESYNNLPNGDLFVELKRDNLTWLARALILEGASFDYRLLKAGHPAEDVHTITIRSKRE